MQRAWIPNSTQIPDVILDHWMAKLSGSELKVLLYVARRTYGFQKDQDNISLTQLASGIRRKDGSTLDRGTGLSPTGVKDACTGLIKKGLLVRFKNVAADGRMSEESTYRLNLFASLPDTPEEVGRKTAYPGRKTAYPEVGRKTTGGRPEKSPGVGRKSATQQTDQETEQQTAAEPPGAADAALVESLVGKGVFPNVAARLARAKPDQCRKCLAWLPDAKPRTTPGRWLANAIEHDFRPPDELQQRTTEEQEARGVTASMSAGSHVAQVERSEEKAERLRETYTQLLMTQPDAITAFEAFHTSERERAEKTAATLTERRRLEYLREADSEEYRLTHFERWLRTEGKKIRSLETDSEPHRLSA